MLNTLDFFIINNQNETTALVVKGETRKIFISEEIIPGSDTIVTRHPFSSKTIAQISEKATGKYMLLHTGQNQLHLREQDINRFMQVAFQTQAGIVYSDYFDETKGQHVSHPVIDYQPGSVRDQFHFGPLLLFRTDTLKQAVKNIKDYLYAGLYAIRLEIYRQADILRIPEHLYTVNHSDKPNLNENHFAYVNPSNTKAQKEYEEAFSEYLKKTGAYLNPVKNKINLNATYFKTEASVIIPVKNRRRTIKEAIYSALRQKCNNSFNIIIVDNHSNDGTTDVIKQLCNEHKSIIHIIPKEKTLGIGGCWNQAIFHPSCGKFALQLDSDDMYKNEDTIEKIVAQFYKDTCAMVIGSYEITDFDKNPIPPGLIDHQEWTDENGHNNALRINGLGAPRAFYTPVARNIHFPDVSYGEDYAMGLAVSRSFRIGRIYEPLYLCRRWEGNTDASLCVEKENKHNFYKDWLRTLEIKARTEIIKKEK
jgi:hypothetical protein